MGAFEESWSKNYTFVVQENTFREQQPAFSGPDRATGAASHGDRCSSHEIEQQA